MYAFPAYTNCSTSIATGLTYYAAQPSIGINTVLYTDPGLITLATGITEYFKEPIIDNGVYVATDEFGVIAEFTRCYVQHALYSSCGNGGGVVYSYTRNNDVLANGIVLYNDSDLTTPVANTDRYLDGVIYSTDANGIITIGYCNTQLSPATYSSCNDYLNSQNGMSFYVRDVEYATPLFDNTKVYNDTLAINEISTQTFVWNNNVYVYLAGNGTTLSSQCST